MSAIFKKILALIASIGLVLLNQFVLSNERQVVSNISILTNDAICNASGECTMDISDSAPNILQICDTSKAYLQWNSKRSGAFLVTCDCQCTSYDNTGWIIDLKTSINERRVQKVYLGKEFTIERLNSRPHRIYDFFSSHSFCESVGNERLEKSIFVSLMKKPTNRDVDPYCFFPVYIVEDGGYLGARTSRDRGRDEEFLRIDESDFLVGVEIINHINKLQIVINK